MLLKRWQIRLSLMLCLFSTASKGYELVETLCARLSERFPKEVLEIEKLCYDDETVSNCLNRAVKRGQTSLVFFLLTNRDLTLIRDEEVTHALTKAIKGDALNMVDLVLHYGKLTPHALALACQVAVEYESDDCVSRINDAVKQYMISEKIPYPVAVIASLLYLHHSGQ